MTTIIFPTVENIRVYVESEYQGEAQPWGDKHWHSHFKVTISVPDSKEEYTTDYYAGRGNTNIEGKESADVLQCLLTDASCYETADNIDEFANEFGWDPSNGIQHIIDAYNGCKLAHTYMEIFGLLQHGGEISEAIDNEDYEIEEDE